MNKELFEKYTVGVEDDNDDSAWIQTYSCLKFHPFNPTPGSIVIQDIAQALSNQCRFSGQLEKFYSVGQHSVLVSYFCDAPLQGLLHDASEAYLVDIPSPLKRTDEFSEYRIMEANLMKIIYNKFGLSEVEHESVKNADRLMLNLEAHSLFKNVRRDWKTAVPNLGIKITPWTPEETRKAFLDRFFELTGLTEEYKLWQKK